MFGVERTSIANIQQELKSDEFHKSLVYFFRNVGTTPTLQVCEKPATVQLACFCFQLRKEIDSTTGGGAAKQIFADVCPLVNSWFYFLYCDHNLLNCQSIAQRLRCDDVALDKCYQSYAAKNAFFLAGRQEYFRELCINVKKRLENYFHETIDLMWNKASIADTKPKN